MFSKRQLLGFALFTSCCFSAQADVIFSNITGIPSFPSDPVCSSPTPGCYDEVGGGFDEAAAAFTPAADFTITDVEVFVQPAFSLQLIDNFFSISLYSDSNGVPGSPIVGLGGGFAEAPPVITDVASPPITVIAGTQYWLVMDSGGYVYWLTGISTAVPSAVISYDGFLGTNPCSPAIHQLAEWCAEGTSTIQLAST